MRRWEKFQSPTHPTYCSNNKDGALSCYCCCHSLASCCQERHIDSFKDQGPFRTIFSTPQCCYLGIASDFVPWRVFIAILLVCLNLLVTVRFAYLNVGGQPLFHGLQESKQHCWERCLEIGYLVRQTYLIYTLSQRSANLPPRHWKWNAWVVYLSVRRQPRSIDWKQDYLVVTWHGTPIGDRIAKSQDQSASQFLL